VAIIVTPTPYGRAAAQRLRDAVVAAKEGEPLAPVTVIVSANSVGVAARRMLASGELGALTDRGRGVVGVNFLTVLRLAELLGAPRLAQDRRRPVSTPVVASAVRSALAREPGIFAPVAEHPATEEALVAAHRELANLTDEELDVLAAQSPRARDIVRLHRATRAALAPRWYDESDLMAAACDAIAEEHSALHDLGTVVCYAPQRVSAPAARLLRGLAETRTMHVLVALTGVAGADGPVHASLERLGVKLDNRVENIEPARATKVISASDADDEVRTIVRGVVDAMREGTPLEQMAVLYGPAEPYARLLDEHLELAGIVRNGASVRTLSDCVLGRALLRLVDLADGAYRRDDVCAFFASAPALDGNRRPVPAIEWERITRKAGIVGGLAEWRQRLDAYSAALGNTEWDERERSRAQALRSFVETLALELSTGEQPKSWAAATAWAHRLIRRFLGDDSRRASWPAIEQDAARRVELALDRLGGLDSVDHAPTLDTFRRTLALELDASRSLVGRLGEGLLVGPVSFALGVDLERVWVCGLAEGVFPTVPHDDPLLGDAERAALHGELRLRAELTDDAERHVLAALASTRGDRICTWPRGDLRRTSERVPSRFLVSSTDAPREEIASYAHGLVVAPFPATRHELAVRAALGNADWVRAEPAVARGRDLLDARASRAFTRFDGNLAALGERLRRVSPLDNERASSPTRLEAWVACPHAYLMNAVLFVEPVERPETIWQLSALDRGSLVHEVLEQFVAEGAFDRTRLRALAETACAAAEARGITGRRLLWERDRRMLFAELDAFFDADDAWRLQRNARPLAAELSFGFAGDGSEPVEVRWDDGRVLRLRGKADRIDVTTAGGLVVIDYKTGKPDSYKALALANPVDRGDHLQLPVYAQAARAAYPGHDSVEAYYWFVGRGNNERIGYAVDDAVDEEFRAVVRTIAEGIEAGIFVANPPAPGPSPFVRCAFCDPDGMGTADGWRAWERKYGAPELAPYRSLIEVPEEEEDV
jgi:RecB family exonuclease